MNGARNVFLNGLNQKWGVNDMRDILFKAKRLDNGEWVEGSLITGVFCRLGQDIPYIFCPKEADYDCFEDFSEENGISEAQPDTICQYTGLTDKNGKKIWENDVVRYYDNLANMNKEDLVKWNETHASFVRLHKSKMGSQYLYIDECIANRCEVIGNIFDNPELLGGGE